MNTNKQCHQETRDYYLFGFVFIPESFPFEIVVLDSALNVTVNKFQHYLSRMKPIFNKLIELAGEFPCEKTLKKIIAFKKSLFLFEQK